MQKIISLFQRNYDGDRLIRDEVVPGAEWVLAGEGVPTEKWDGTCCMVRGNRLYKRYDAKRGRTPPASFEPAQPEPDSVTGHWPGWVPVSDDDPADGWHRAAWALWADCLPPPDGTYELIGIGVQGNPYGSSRTELTPHGWHVPPWSRVLRTFDSIRQGLTEHPEVEGLVWHHPDGRMVKIKRRDFGLPWPPSRA